MKAFTLIEIVIVMLIIGVITWMVMLLSGEQLHKLQRESVKQNILTTYQSRYSKNLTSSFFANERYDEMQISFKGGESWIWFTYSTGENVPYWNDAFIGNFVIEKIFTTPENYASPWLVDALRVHLKPYEISCSLQGVDNQTFSSLVVMMRVKQQKNYCFSLYDTTCRMMVLPDEICKEYEVLGS